MPTGGVPELLSSLTLGLLHDSGWYKPDYSVALVSPFGHAAGCEFVEEPCIVEGVSKFDAIFYFIEYYFESNTLTFDSVTVPSYSSGSFCNSEYKIEEGKFAGQFGCDPTHTSMGICDLVDYATMSSAYTPPPFEFQYYPDSVSSSCWRV